MYRTLRRAVCAWALLWLATGCTSDKFAGILPPNEPPTVWLNIAPPEGATVDYNVRIFWGGWDPDGDVAHYEFVITDNPTGIFSPADTTGQDKWRSTVAKDSVFLFSADVLIDSLSAERGIIDPLEFRRSHTFFIRAVDDRGARSPAVYRSFTARNLSPIVTVTSPPGSFLTRVPPVVTFRWVASDFITSLDEQQPPDSVRTIIVNTNAYHFQNLTQRVMDYIRTNQDAPEWTGWVDYDAPADSGRFWQPPEPLSLGTYIFAVQAKDEAGAVTPVFDLSRNARRVRVQNTRVGPGIVLKNKFVGTASASGVNSPISVIDIPAGVPLDFAFSGDASSYGGVVSGYRYGWDIIDLNDDEQWGVGFTPFVGPSASAPTRRFFFGTHTFHVEVIDNSGLISRLNVTINVVSFTMTRPLLLIDDWWEGSTESFHATRGFAPSDQEDDEFWREVLSDVDGFNPQIDVIPNRGPLNRIPITLIAQYKTIIWNVRGSSTRDTQSLLGESIEFGSDEINLATLFMAAGGRMLLCGKHVMTMVINKQAFPSGRFGQGEGPPYPFIYRTELPGAGDPTESFAYRECCLNVVDVAYGRPIGRLRSTCRAWQLRDWDARDEGIRACVSVDEDYNFPRLELRREITAGGRFYNESSISLPTDVYNPRFFDFCAEAELDERRDCFQPMYGLECRDTGSPIFGETIAYWTSASAGIGNVDGENARSAIWGFAPVFFKAEQVKEALSIIMFDEWKLEPRQ